MSIFSASGTATPMKNVDASTGSPLIQQLLTQIQNQQMQNQQPQPIQPQIFQPQPKAQLGLPLVLQQLYGPEAGAMIQQPVDPAPQGGFTTSPGFRPAIGVPQGGINNIAFAPGYGSSILNPGIRTADFRDRDGDGVDDRDQVGPGQPKFKFADFSLGDSGAGMATLPTLAQLAAFNPIANSYALAGFTVGEIAAMPEFAGYGASVGSNVTGLPSTTQAIFPTRQRGPEDRDTTPGPMTQVVGDDVFRFDEEGNFRKVDPEEDPFDFGLSKFAFNLSRFGPLSLVDNLFGGTDITRAYNAVANTYGKDVADDFALNTQLGQMARDTGKLDADLRKAVALKANQDKFNKGEISQGQKAVNDAKIDAGYAGLSRDAAQTAMEAAAEVQGGTAAKTGKFTKGAKSDQAGKKDTGKKDTKSIGGGRYSGKGPSF